MNRRLFLQSIGLSGLALLAPNSWAQTELMTGVHYKVLKKPQPIAPAKKKVVEVFGYGCPHCYHLEDSLNEWLKNKPEDVEFERMPVVFNNPNWIFMARVFYTAQELGILEQSHEAFFHAIHRDRKPLFSVDALADFYTQFGVEKQKFIDTYTGFSVDQKIRQAGKLTRDYEVEGVPALIVNGKYLTDVPMAGSRKELWQVVDQLVEM
ncbi:thiol:disulfide interchange protein DsbA/DsbL [Thiomicrorhabdus xiamenensis]|uniref:Thiol:disulfide interchange protein n=1 Tax=Thiomicrorhabdus xiamenensis TaxID=2739063 RepID=A0A7D4TCK5_9GAMM|nr:thiol:disulfide interchange protein DsbA/DsbL [Thiomicrorhabdus xiamenensis]QKI88087.1 thiol:disulfide interchange protein DsbA/DsbL [Thiomicrorhabdus xiamenensis]